jgi:hypothetical protein
MAAAVRTVVLSTCVVLTFLFALVAFAYAQDAPPVLPDPPPPANPNPAALIAWCGVAYAILSAVTSALREDNTAIPFGVSAKARMAILALAGAGAAFALAVTKATPWPMAIAIGFGGALSIYATHGERTAPPADPARVARAVSEEISAAARHPPPASRGFARLHAMLAVALFGLVVVACGVFGSGPAPRVATDGADLGICEAKLARDNPGLPLPAFVRLSLSPQGCASAGARVVTDVLDAILSLVGSSDPAVAAYQELARPARESPPKLGALRRDVGHE